jgi:hypothetical protein
MCRCIKCQQLMCLCVCVCVCVCVCLQDPEEAVSMDQVPAATHEMRQSAMPMPEFDL